MKTTYLLALALLLGQCKTSPAPTPTPPSQLSLLPPETQTGARTFGCLVNGQAWTPAGSPFIGPVFAVQVYILTPTSPNPKFTLSLICRRESISNNATTIQRIAFVIDSLRGTGAYMIGNTSNADEFTYHDVEARCRYTTSNGNVATVELTRLDIVRRIVSGRFSATMSQAGCAPVTITDGRFDTRF